jgi:uncharacterized cupin superfamily protein
VFGRRHTIHAARQANVHQHNFKGGAVLLKEANGLGAIGRNHHAIVPPRQQSSRHALRDADIFDHQDVGCINDRRC